MAQEVSQKTVNGVTETVKKSERGNLSYIYITKETKNLCDSLSRNSTSVFYEEAFPEVIKHTSPTSSAMKCRDYIQGEILKRAYIKDRLAGIRIFINIYSLQDGAVVLRSIHCKESLLSTLGTDEIKELAEIVQSYKFERFISKKIGYLGWGINIFIPNK